MSSVTDKLIDKAVDKAVDKVVQSPSIDVSQKEAAPVRELVSNEVKKSVGAIVEHATNNEPWYRSRVTIGSIVAITSPITSRLLSAIIGETVTINAEEQAAITDLLMALISAIGGGYSIYGRLIARKPIGR